MAYERKTGGVYGGNFNNKRMANGTLSSLFSAEFDETSWCAAPAPRKQSIRNILGYAAAAQSPEIESMARFTALLN